MQQQSNRVRTNRTTWVSMSPARLGEVERSSDFERPAQVPRLSAWFQAYVVLYRQPASMPLGRERKKRPSDDGEDKQT